MLRFQPVDAVVFRADMSGVNGMREDIGDALLFDFAVLVAGKVRERFKEPFHLGLGFEPARRVTLKSLLDDCIKRRFAEQHAPATFDRFVAVADGRSVDPIAGFHPRTHLLADLPGILLALELTLGGENGLHELAFRGVVKGEVEAFQLSFAIAESITEAEMEVSVACEALEIIENHDKLLVPMLIEKREQRQHAGAFHEIAAASHRIREDHDDLVAFGRCVLATARFLGFKPMAVGFLALR